jgi:hypothetical protein
MSRRGGRGRLWGAEAELSIADLHEDCCGDHRMMTASFFEAVPVTLRLTTAQQSLLSRGWSDPAIGEFRLLPTPTSAALKLVPHAAAIAVAEAAFRPVKRASLAAAYG